MTARKPAAPAGHHCLIASVHGGIGLCACGQAWTPAGSWLRNLYLVSPDLLQRLKFHKRAVTAGRAASLRDSVKRSAAYEAAREAAERAGACGAWHSRQSGKRQKWMRVMREMMLPAPCAYCGGAADLIEHVIPRTRGGLDKRSNVVPACTRCNLAKRNRTPEEWKADRLRRGQPWPPPWGKKAA